MTLKEIQHKIYEKLIPSGWGDKLKMFLLSDEFYSILKTLHDQSQDGKKFTPVLKDLFRAFEECPYKDLKMVMIAKDPYPRVNVADGILFSCSKTGRPQPSLELIFKELEATVYPDGYTWDPDLKRWSNQGILMLHTSLTTELNKIGSHEKLWEPFIAYLFDILNTNNTGIVYIFFGEHIKEWRKKISSENNYKFFTSHPISGNYTKFKQWNSGNLFNAVNDVMHKMYNEKIEW